MKRISTYLLITLVGILGISCEDLIEVDVPEGDTKLVVEALLYNSDSEHTITLSTTAPYFDKNETPRVTGATVYLQTIAGDSIAFEEKEVGSGNYKAFFQLEENKEYFLNIITPAGRIYRSYGEKLLRVPPLELYQNDKYLDSLGGFRPAGYYVSLRTLEPEGIGDYYRWIIFINGEQQLSPQYFWIADDKLVDGNLIDEFPQFFVYGMQVGDSVEIWQTSISSRAYSFWYLLQEQAFNSGSPFDTPPSSAKGNIIGLSSPNETVLGYFSVCAVQKGRITVKAR